MFGKKLKHSKPVPPEEHLNMLVADCIFSMKNLNRAMKKHNIPRYDRRRIMRSIVKDSGF